MKKLVQKFGIIIIALFIPMSASAYDFEVDGIFYNIISASNLSVEVTYKSSGGGSYAGVIKIPNSVIYNNRSYTVTCIGGWTFFDCDDLISVSIPSSVTSLGEQVFKNCRRLESINVDDGNLVFMSIDGILYSKNASRIIRCPMSKNAVDIPNSVTSIGNWAFEGCSFLVSISIPVTVTNIGKYAFDGCIGLASLVIPNSVSTIADHAFCGCSSLLSVTIPNSVTSLGDNAFSCCSGMTHVTLGNSLTSLKQGIFSGCSSLTSVTIPSSVTSIENMAFESCTALRSVTIPNSVASIGDYAFSQCTNLSQFVIPNSLFWIGRYAFAGCDSLKSMEIGESVISIGDWAFGFCSSLSSVIIPNTISYIGYNAFFSCHNLEEIYMQRPSPVEFFCLFSDNVLKNAILYVPVGTKAAYEKVDPWRNFWNIEEIDYAGIEDVEADRELQISVEGGCLNVEGVDADDIIMVYDLSGRVVYSGADHSVSGLGHGVYILKVRGKTAKFAI